MNNPQRPPQAEKSQGVLARRAQRAFTYGKRALWSARPGAFNTLAFLATVILA